MTGGGANPKELLADESFLYRLGYEYGSDPDSHEHFDGCGHDGQGVERDFLNGWRAGRALRGDSIASEGSER